MGSSRLPFPFEEYAERWARVYAAAKKRGESSVVVWQRSGGSFDRAGNVYWLSNYASLASGQERNRPGAYGRAFAALLFADDRDPELHIAEPVEATDVDSLATRSVTGHANLIEGVSARLGELEIGGPVLYVGDDMLPAVYARALTDATPDVTWVPADDLLDDAMMIKSALELDVYREAGAIASSALEKLMRALIRGESEAGAAAEAAAEVIRSGGGLQRVGVHHGSGSEAVMWSSSFYGYSDVRPTESDLVRAWLYGPVRHGYWLDPARTAVVGNRPTPAQRELIEGAAAITEGMMAAIRPGVPVSEVESLGDELSRTHGAAEHAQKAFIWGFGHGVGTFFGPPFIRMGTGFAAAPDAPRNEETFREGMVLGIEAMLTHEGVGSAGFEQNLVVTSDGTDVLISTPMIFW